MNKILCFLMVLLVATSCKNDSEKDVVKSYYENGNLKSELRYKEGRLNGKCVWLLIRGGDRMKKSNYGNASDDCVENYNYDYYFVNDKTLAEAEKDFSAFIADILAE